MFLIILIVTTLFDVNHSLDFRHPGVRNLKPTDIIPYLHNQSCNNCERVYFPVCATDNQTYTNECRLNCMNEKRFPAPPVKVKMVGPCLYEVPNNEEK